MQATTFAQAARQPEQAQQQPESDTSRRKRVLLLAHAFPPENVSGAKRPSRFARYLPSHGYDVDVITASGPHPGADSVHTAPHVEERPNVHRARAAAAFIQRWMLPYNDQLPWVPSAIARAEEILVRRGASVVISTSPPVGAHMAAAYLRSRYGLKWLADFRDPLYGNPWRQRQLAWIYDSAVERYIIHHADAVVANTDNAAGMLRKRYPRHASKIALLENGYDPEDVVEPSAIPVRDYVTLTHCGILGGKRHPGRLVDAIERLVGRGALNPARFKLELVGPMDLNDSWIATSSFHRLAERGCIEYTARSLPEAEARARMAQADYLLLIDAEAGLQLPAKIFDYVRVGRPILAVTPDTSPAARILARSGILHTSVHPGAPPEKMDAAVLSHIALRSDPQSPSEWFTDTFAGDKQTQRLARLLDGCFQRS